MKMSGKMENKAGNTQNVSKWSQGCVEIRTVYGKHFPTDRRTFNVRVPVVGIVLSMYSILLFVNAFDLDDPFRRSSLLIIPYFVFVIGVGWELYYGLKIGDRKQYTPWILLKVVENLLLSATMIKYGFRIQWYTQYAVGMSASIILLIINVWLTYIIASKSLKQVCGSTPKRPADDNIYDNYDSV